MKYLSVCSGIEAASVAWHDFGWEPVGFAEIEPFPSAVLAHRFPNVKNYGDITKYKEWDIRPGTVDVLVGGPPCQAFSCAGLRAGLADPRGNLTLVYVGMVDHFKPRWVLYENVPGLLSSNGGRDFSAFVKALADIGYGVCWRMLDAQHFGVPQRRRRLYLVGYPGNWRPPAAVLFESHRLCGDSPQSKEKGEDIAPASGASVDKGCEPRRPITFGTANNREIANTLETTCHDYSRADGFNMIVEPIPAVLQPKPIVIDRAAFNQGKNAQYDIRIEETETMDTLVAKGPHAVAHPPKPVAVDTYNQTVSDTAQSICSARTDCNHKGAVLVPQDARPIPINTMAALRPESSEQNRQTFGVGQPGDHQFTISANHPHAVAQPSIAFKVRGGGEYSGTKGGEVKPNEHGGTGMLSYVEKTFTLAATQDQYLAHPVHTPSSEIAPTITSSGPPYSRTGNERVETEALVAVQKESHIATEMVVRRITPLEAERLQGFPDNWTRIPWRGKAEEDCPDGPRYKACGNSMATPVMRWIGLRIAFVDSVLQSKVCQDTSASSHTPSSSEPL